MRARVAVLLSIGAVWLWPVGAGADVGPDLREGDRAVDALDYQRAVEAFERVTADREAGPAELVHAYSALVRCQVVLGNESSARLAAEQLLEIDPGARLEGGGIPPRVTRFFEDLRRGYQRTTEALVTVVLPDPIPSGRSMSVSARVTRGRRGVSAVRLHVQFGEGEAPLDVDLEARERGWGGRVQVPATFDPQVSSLRYWVEALAPSGAALGGLGNAEEPMVVAPTGRRSGRQSERPDPDLVPEPDDPRRPAGEGEEFRQNQEFFRQRYAITSQWWFWTGIAVVAAGGVLTAAMIATDEGEAARVPRDGGVWPLQ